MPMRQRGPTFRGRGGGPHRRGPPGGGRPARPPPAPPGGAPPAPRGGRTTPGGAPGVFEGEDRIRCYGWHTTPFYAPPVFDTAACLPRRHKRDDRFRTRVLALVAPTTADLPSPSTGAAPGATTATWRRRVERFGKAVVFHAVGDETERRLPHWLRPANGHDQRSPVLRLIREQLRGTGPVRDYLRPAAVERLLDDAAAYRSEQF